MKRYRHNRVLILYRTLLDARAADMDAAVILPRNATFIVLEYNGDYCRVLSGTMSGWFWLHGSLLPSIEVVES